MEESWFTFLVPISAVLAPFLIYLASRQKLDQEGKRDHAQDERGLWERMATMVDRYGRRADDLERKLTEMQQAAEKLSEEVSGLRGMLRRWRNYAIALARQMQGAGITPVSPADFGLDENDWEEHG
jgi:predicted RNase H-like nuclease (RuvC/YqgF family)